MVDKTTKTLWRGHRRRLEGQITEYARILRAIEGRLLRIRGRLQRATGDAQVRLAFALERVESDYQKIVEGWQAILKGLDHTFASGRRIGRQAIDRADAVLSESSPPLSARERALRRARVEVAALRKGLQVGLRRGRRMAAVASRRRAKRSKPESCDSYFIG